MNIYDNLGASIESSEISSFKLKDILATVKEMWKNMGLEIPDATVIPGDNLQDKIDWLNNKLLILRNEKLELEGMIKAENENSEIIEKSESLANNDNIKITLAALRNKEKELQNELDYLIKECDKKNLLDE